MNFFSLLMVFYLTVIDILRFIFIWQCTLRCRDKKFPFLPRDETDIVDAIKAKMICISEY